MAPRAQLSQERSRQRREALLEAAVDLFVEGGSRAVTHRAVAAAAGLPPATTTYYFSTIAELLREALHHHIEQWLQTMESFVDVDVRLILPMLDERGAEEIVNRFFEQRPVDLATRELAVILGAARDPQLSGAAVRAVTAGAEVLESVFTALGIADAAALADDVEAMVAGVALRRAAGVRSERQEAAALARGMRRLLVGALTDPQDQERMLTAVRDRAGEAATSESLSGRSAASRSRTS